MDISSSSESEDIIDDTGCEDKWQETYWDINYIHSINNDDIGDIEEEDLPHARVIRRFAYKEFDTNGEEVQESYIRDESEEEYDYSEENSDDSSTEEDSCNNSKDQQDQDQMNKSGENDEFYDPNRDDKDAAWMEQHHGCSTGAILCCPSCFTTICYTGKPMHRRSDPHGIVFMSDEVSNCLELLDSAVEVNIKGEDGKLRKVSSYKLICDVCENEVGFKREGKYYITGAIEENASICFVC